MSNNENPKPASIWLLKIALTVFFTALTVAGAYIAFPIGPIPLTLQNLFILLSGLVLGPVMGTAAVSLYLLAGILNFPVFALGGGGIVRFTGPAGGYFVGYFFAALTAGLIVGSPKADTSANTSQTRITIAAITALVVSYVPGLIWYKIRMNLDWANVFLTGFVPFIIGDTLKGTVAVLIASRLRKIATDFLDAG